MRATHGNLRFVLITSLFLSAPAFGAGWIALFDGHSFNGWTTQNGGPVEEGAWEVVDGTIHLNTSVGRGGNLITDRDYGDFELLFEWKNSTGGNNGIKYRVKDFDGRVLGCEYQIIDDERHTNLRPTQRTASLYDIYEPSADDLLKPIGEFNRGRIVVCGNRIEHWLNGHLVVAATTGSPEWEERIGNSKFSDVEGFGKNRCGRIMLTDHNDEIWFRNIYVRSLSSGRRLASLSTTRARRFTCYQRVRPRATLRNVLCRR
jgi:hypothetical protein